MNWTRLDDIDEFENLRVRYLLTGFDFEIRATKLGVQLTGTTPYYTDWTTVNEKITWCQYQSQKIRETGCQIPQDILDRGEI